MNEFKIEKIGNYKLENGNVVKINCILNGMCIDTTGKGMWWTEDGKPFTSNEMSFKYNIVDIIEKENK